MNILLLGSGGRESAFAWKISQSQHCSQLFIAPGNAGTGAYGKNVNLKITDFEAIRTFVLKNAVKIDLKIIDDDFKNIYEDLVDLEEALGSSPELNAFGKYRDDGFFQAVQNLQEAYAFLADLFEKICKTI